jgi:hypothetical protein
VTGPTPSRALAGDGVLEFPLVRELLELRLVGILATLDPVLTIHAVPMWYASDGGAVVFATSSRSRKVANLDDDPRATLTLHDSRPGYEVCGALLAGSVEVVRGAAAAELVDLVHRRYLAVDAEADEAVAAYLVSDDVALRLTPASGITWDERDSEPARVVRERGWALPLAPTTPRA